MMTINTNPYFIGLMMLSLNLGGRFLGLEISKEQEKFLSQPMVRRFFLFAVLFVATRNIIIAAGTTVIVILLLGYLFNENSSLCLWKYCAVPPGLGGAEGLGQGEGQGEGEGEGQEKEKKEGFTGKGLSPDEQQMLRRLLDKQNAAAAAEQEAADGGSDGKAKAKQAFDSQSSMVLNTYARNMNALAASRAGGRPPLA
jgi:hypothetical protein